MGEDVLKNGTVQEKENKKRKGEEKKGREKKGEGKVTKRKGRGGEGRGGKVSGNYYLSSLGIASKKNVHNYLKGY